MFFSSDIYIHMWVQHHFPKKPGLLIYKHYIYLVSWNVEKFWAISIPTIRLHIMEAKPSEWLVTLTTKLSFVVVVVMSLKPTVSIFELFGATVSIQIIDVWCGLHNFHMNSAGWFSGSGRLGLLLEVNPLNFCFDIQHRALDSKSQLMSRLSLMLCQ